MLLVCTAAASTPYSLSCLARPSVMTSQMKRGSPPWSSHGTYTGAPAACYAYAVGMTCHTQFPVLGLQSCSINSIQSELLGQALSHDVTDEARLACMVLPRNVHRGTCSVRCCISKHGCLCWMCSHQMHCLVAEHSKGFDKQAVAVSMMRNALIPDALSLICEHSLSHLQLHDSGVTKQAMWWACASCAMT